MKQNEAIKLTAEVVETLKYAGRARYGLRYDGRLFTVRGGVRVNWTLAEAQALVEAASDEYPQWRIDQDLDGKYRA